MLVKALASNSLIPCISKTMCKCKAFLIFQLMQTFFKNPIITIEAKGFIKIRRVIYTLHASPLMKLEDRQANAALSTAFVVYEAINLE